MSNKTANKPSRLKKFYDDKILPKVVDKVCALDKISEKRLLVVPKAYGVVLEVGVGSGHNAGFYNGDRIKKVIGIDPHMHSSAAKRFAKAGIDFEAMILSAETLPLEDNSVDSIVMTFTLCSIPDPLQALEEMRRVLKPTGTLFYAEHGLAPSPKVVNTIQKTITPVWSPIAGGCHLDRDIEKLLIQAGFKVSGNQGFDDRVSMVGYYYWGEATVGEKLSEVKD